MQHTGQSQGAFRASSTPWLFVVAAVVAAITQLITGYLYLVSGLIAPGWAVIGLLAVWLALTVIGVRLALRKSYRVLLTPVIAVVVWVVTMWAGGALLGWTA